MRRRLRLILLTVVISVTALLLAAGIAVYSLLQPKRITDMLRDQARDVGLTLVLGAPAEPTLWPQPALVLHSLTLSSNNRPVLVAARARVVLPWRTLLGGPPNITRMELDAPRLHIDQLGRLLQHDAKSPDQAPVLPHVNAGMRISHGSIVNDGQLMLDGLDLETGPLRPDRVFNLLIRASAHEQAFKLTLLTTPHQHHDGISLDNIHITTDAESGAHVVLDGTARWRGGTDIHLMLDGTLLRGDGRSYATSIAMQPPRADQASTFHLGLDGPGLNADLDLPPSRLADWWHQVTRSNTTAELSLPPFEGHVEADSLDIGNTHIEGLQLQSGSSVPAPASSTVATDADSARDTP